MSDEIPLESQCDLIERELKMALKDVAEIRANEAIKAGVKRRFYLLRAALLNAKHYLTELENSLNQ